MRSLVLLTLLLASGASAQSGLSLGFGPATGMYGPASYVEARGRIALTSLLAVEPTVGVGTEAGEYYVAPECPPQLACEGPRTGQVGESVSLALGGVLTFRAPEASLPGPLADAHIGAFAQIEGSTFSGDVMRYGLEIGAVARVTRGLTLGLMLQAAQRSGPDPRYRGYPKRDHEPRRPTSLVPMLRLGYTPEAREQQGSSAARRARYGLASGFATGFGGGAVQTEIRASVPVGPVLAIEPSVAFLAASDYDAPARCAADRRCAPVREEGKSALMLGLGVAAHSGRFRVAGVPLADAYLGTGAYLVSPTAEEPDDLRLALVSGAAVQVARGVALGAELQVSTYNEASQGSAWGSIAPMLRLTVGG